jgi:hypothetical protein
VAPFAQGERGADTKAAEEPNVGENMAEVVAAGAKAAEEPNAEEKVVKAAEEPAVGEEVAEVVGDEVAEVAAAAADTKAAEEPDAEDSVAKAAKEPDAEDTVVKAAAADGASEEVLYAWQQARNEKLATQVLARKRHVSMKNQQKIARRQKLADQLRESKAKTAMTEARVRTYLVGLDRYCAEVKCDVQALVVDAAEMKAFVGNLECRMKVTEGLLAGVQSKLDAQV